VAAKPINRIRVWDLPVRLFHWSLAASFIIAFLTSESERWRDTHVLAGYVMAGLILFRVIWGFLGSTHARFADFLPTPSKLKIYMKSLFSGRPEHYVGHNPAGAIAIIALLILGLVSVTTGWVTYEEIGGSRIAKWMEELHEGAANAMMLVVGIHLAGVVVSSWLHHENLVRAMITGWKKPAPTHESSAG
jgi:cytochrome b